MNDLKTNPSSMRTIWFALLMGQLMFAGVAFVLRSSGSMAQALEQTPEAVRFRTIMVAIGIVFLVVCASAAMLLPAFFKPGDLRMPPTTEALSTRQIIRMALLEGASLFGIVIYLVTGSLGGLAISAVAVALFVAITFPHAMNPPAQDKSGSR
jgi:predicted transporter